MTTLISPRRWEDDKRIISLSPTIYDRSKIAKMMKKYAFVRPSIHRYRSPEIRNKVLNIKVNQEDVQKHHFDLNEVKKNLFSKKIRKFQKPKRPAFTTLNLPVRPRKKESELSSLFLESPFIKEKQKNHLNVSPSNSYLYRQRI